MGGIALPEKLHASPKLTSPFLSFPVAMAFLPLQSYPLLDSRAWSACDTTQDTLRRTMRHATPASDDSRARDAIARLALPPRTSFASFSACASPPGRRQYSALYVTTTRSTRARLRAFGVERSSGSRLSRPHIRTWSRVRAARVCGSGVRAPKLVIEPYSGVDVRGSVERPVNALAPAYAPTSCSRHRFDGARRS